MLLALLLATTGPVAQEAAGAQPASGGLVQMPELLPGYKVPYPDPPGLGGPAVDCQALVDIDAQGGVQRLQIKACPPPFAQQLLDHGPNYRFKPGATVEGPVPVRIDWQELFRPPLPPKPKILPVRLLGQVREAGTGVVLPGIQVTVADLAVETDGKGRFQFRGVGDGQGMLRFRADGYHPHQKSFALASDEQLEFTIYLRPTAANRFVAVVRKKKEEPHVVRRTLHAEELARVPGTMGDPIRAVQRLPGVARSPFFGGQLLVRGSSASDTGIYIDNQEVPLLFHFGGGPSIINPDMVEQIDFLPGGFGAKYGRATAGIIDVKTRRARPDRFSGKLDVDFLDSGFRVEGPLDSKGRWAGAVAARRSYVDQLLPIALAAVGEASEVRVQPVYWDYQARIDYVKKGSRTKGGLHLYGSDDVFRLVSGDEEAARREGRPPGIGIHTLFHRLVGELDHRLSRASKLRAIAALGTTQTGGDIGDINWSLGFESLALRVDLENKFSKEFKLYSGLDFAGQDWSSRSRFPVAAIFERSFPGSDLGDEPTLTDNEEGGGGTGVGLHSTLQWKPVKGVDVFPGLRFDSYHFREESRYAFEPRLSLQWSLDRNQLHKLKGQVGHYTQLPDPVNLSETIGNPKLDLEKAWQYGLGYSYQFDSHLSLDLQAFAKRMWDQLSGNRNYVAGGSEPRLLNDGRGRAYGLEFMLRHRPGPRPYFGWIAYTLSRSERFNDQRPEDGWFLFNLDQTHILNTVLGYKFGFGWVAGLTLRLVSGTPTTTLTGARYDVDTGDYRPTRTERNDSRKPVFFQADARIEKRLARKRTAWLFYLDVMNVTNHENTEFYIYQYDYRTRSSLPGLPIFPSLGLEYSW